MPLTHIHAPRHWTAERVRSLAAIVHDGLVHTCQVPPQDLFQLVSRHDADELIVDPTFGGVMRSRDACIVHVTLLRGRSDDQKRYLYAHVAARAVAAGLRADDVMLALSENTAMDWSLGAGTAYADHVRQQHADA